jgi:uncharacterized protein (TIGR02996 family)
VNEWAALREAIVEDPDDDVRRLMLADWLEEHGRARESEFVRAQVQMARCVEEPADPFESTAGLWDRQLAPDLRRVLLAPFLPLAPARLREEGERLSWLHRRFAFGFRRGFVDALIAYGGGAVAQLSRHGKELFVGVPLLHLCVSPAAARPLREYPAEVGFGTGHAELNAAGLRSLLGLPLLARLRTLDLRNHWFGDTEAELILRCPRLAPTLRLNLAGNRITADLERQLRERFGDNLTLYPFDPGDDIPF